MNSTSPLFLYLDIETVPSHDPAILADIIEKHRVPELDLDGITPAANLKDEDKIAADIEKRRAKAKNDHAASHKKASDLIEEDFRRLCLDATTGHIACVSAALGSDTVEHARNFALNGYVDPEDGEMDMLPLEDVIAGELEMLGGFFDAIERMLYQRAVDAGVDDIPTPIVVAHHAQFDIRYIWQRAVILGVWVPDWWPHDAKPWDQDRIDDTMIAWAGANGRIGLDRLCRALEITGKPGDIDGSKVWDAVREGRLDDVVEYCDGDVDRLRNVHRRIRGIEVVAPDDTADVIEPLGTVRFKLVNLRPFPTSEGDLA